MRSPSRSRGLRLVASLKGGGSQSHLCLEASQSRLVSREVRTVPSHLERHVRLSRCVCMPTGGLVDWKGTVLGARSSSSMVWRTLEEEGGRVPGARAQGRLPPPVACDPWISLGSTSRFGNVAHLRPPPPARAVFALLFYGRFCVARFGRRQWSSPNGLASRGFSWRLGGRRPARVGGPRADDAAEWRGAARPTVGGQPPTYPLTPPLT